MLTAPVWVVGLWPTLNCEQQTAPADLEPMLASAQAIIHLSQIRNMMSIHLLKKYLLVTKLPLMDILMSIF